MGTISIIKPKSAVALPDNDQWCERFEIRSESSNRIYIVAKNKKSGKYGCSCPGYLTKRKCKHLLDGCGLDSSEIHGSINIESKTHKVPRIR